MVQIGDKIRISSQVGMYSDGRPVCGSFAMVTQIHNNFLTVVTFKEQLEFQIRASQWCFPNVSWWGSNLSAKDIVKDYIDTELNLSGSSRWKIGSDGWGVKI